MAERGSGAPNPEGPGRSPVTANPGEAAAQPQPHLTPVPSTPILKARKERAPEEAEENGDRKAAKAAEKVAKKTKKKEAKQARDATRPLESWERYRALTDLLEESHDLVDLADHKARFALVIMGAVNLALFMVATRGEVVDAIPPALRQWTGLYLVFYALVALFFFIQAIESLRPRKATPHVPYPDGSRLDEHPMGLRFYEDVLRRDLEAYRRAWREVRIGQLNAELAVQAHTLARINQAKYRALQRLYLGLQLMTLMAAGLLSVIAYTIFTRPDAWLAGAVPSATGQAVLASPQTVPDAGVREPSGVTYDAELDRLFVVGDEGRIAELDRSGRLLRADAFKGNLEDLTVHTPTGQLVLLSERRSELILYDPVAHQERSRWRIDPAAALGREPTDRNQGFEGIAFREVYGMPGGGVFYLVHQRGPAMVVALAWDPKAGSGTLGRDAVIGRWSLPGYKDLTAITYVPSLDRLLVIADAKDRLLVVTTDGKLEAELGLTGGQQQEGLGFDADGTLWVADDRGGLLRYPGALAQLRSPRVDPSASPARWP